MALRNGTLSSPKAIETAERHREIIELRKQGVEEAEIARRFSISQQAVSKTVLKHVRDLPAKEAADLRRAYLERLERMRETAMVAALNPATSTMQVLRVLRIWERVDDRIARVLGLYNHPSLSIRASGSAASASSSGNGLPPPGGPVDAAIIKQIQELDPIDFPDDTNERGLDDDSRHEE